MAALRELIQKEERSIQEQKEQVEEEVCSQRNEIESYTSDEESIIKQSSIVEHDFDEDEDREKTV